MSPDVGRLLRPSSVAVLGASNDPAKLGGRVLANLQHLRPEVEIHRINPRGGDGFLTSLAELPSPVDVVISAVPKAVVQAELSVLEQSTRSLIVLASGFSETGDEAAQQSLAELHRRGVGILGPNTVGLVNGERRLALTFSVAVQRASVELIPDGLAIITQSGAMGARLFSGALRRGLPVASFVGTGNESGFTVADFLEDAATRGTVAGVLLHLENFRGWDRVRSALELCRDQGLPVSVLLGGRSEQGQRAAASHTGAMMSAGGLVAKNVLAEIGFKAASSDGELLDLGSVMMSRRPLRGRRVGLVSISGGAAVLLADQAIDAGLEPAAFSPHTLGRLRELLPDYVDPTNPVDLTAAYLEKPSLMSEVVTTVAEDPEIDGIVVFGDQRLLDGPQHRPKSEKPIVGCITDHEDVATGPDPVPYFNDIARAIKALSGVSILASGPGLERPDEGEAAPESPSLSEAMEWMGRAGIATPPWTRETTVAAAVAAGHALWGDGGVVIKGDVASRVHKAAAGALRVIKDPDLLERACSDIVGTHGAVVVQQLALDIRFEILCGVHDLAPFGPRLLVGWGGSWAEQIARSVSRPAGLSDDDIRGCLQEVGLASAFTSSFGADSYVLDHTVALIRRLVDNGGAAGREINPIAVTGDGTVQALDIRFSH